VDFMSVPCHTPMYFHQKGDLSCLRVIVPELKARQAEQSCNRDVFIAWG